MLSLNDAALIEGLRAGDGEAFRTLLDRYGGRLLRVARRLLGSEEDARDALQDAMLAVFKSIGNFESNSMLSTWLHRIVVNASLMKLRSKRRRGDEIDIEDYLPRFQEDGHQVEASTPWSESAQSMLERDELRELVRDSIARLPENYRTVLQLRDIEEMSTEEVAEVLGITTNAVKIRLHRARQALRALLDEHMKS
jgi:RNA polymerase sigma-70 factor (ECF subfamily)